MAAANATLPAKGKTILPRAVGIHARRILSLITVKLSTKNTMIPVLKKLLVKYIPIKEAVAETQMQASRNPVVADTATVITAIYPVSISKSRKLIWRCTGISILHLFLRWGTKKVAGTFYGCLGRFSGLA